MDYENEQATPESSSRAQGRSGEERAYSWDQVPGVRREEEPPAWAQSLLRRVSDLQHRTEQNESLTRQYPQPSVTSEPSRMSPASVQGRNNDSGTDDTHDVKRTKILAHPPWFDGFRKSEFQPWLSQVAAKLSVDMSRDTETVRFWYVHSRLKRKTLS